MIKTDVDGLYVQKKGVIINNNLDAFNEYNRLRGIMNVKNHELDEMKIKINNIENKLNKILESIK